MIGGDKSETESRLSQATTQCHTGWKATKFYATTKGKSAKPHWNNFKVN